MLIGRCRGHPGEAAHTCILAACARSVRARRFSASTADPCPPFLHHRYRVRAFARGERRSACGREILLCGDVALERHRAHVGAAAMIDAFIGSTPLVRLERIVEPGMAEVWVKVE